MLHVERRIHYGPIRKHDFQKPTTKFLFDAAFQTVGKRHTIDRRQYGAFGFIGAIIVDLFQLRLLKDET